MSTVAVASSPQKIATLERFVEASQSIAKPSTKINVNKEACIAYGLKIQGTHSKGPNGKVKRIYTDAALDKAVRAGLYENVVVNYTPHTQEAQKLGAKDSRSAIETLGKFINTRFVAGEGVVGDLKYLKTVPFSATFVEACEEMPDVWGFSPILDGAYEVKDGIQYVTEIVNVKCVDLVRNPATTKSLAESQDESGSMCDSCGKVKSILESTDMDDSGKLGKLKEVYSMAEAAKPPVSPATDMNSPGKVPQDIMKESLAESQAAPKVDELDKAIAEAARIKKIKTLAESYDVELGDELEALSKLDDAAAVKLIKKMALAESVGPKTAVPAPEPEAKAAPKADVSKFNADFLRS